MKKDKENQPIDDLFARKLGNLSLPPSSDGFERLQARINQHDGKAKVVIWHNPVVQRYMAVAACLIVICLVGWLYWPNTDTKDSRVAIKQLQRSLKEKGGNRKEESNEAVAKLEQNSSSKEKAAHTPSNAAIETMQNHPANSHTTRLESNAQFAAITKHTDAIKALETKPTLAQVQPVNEVNSQPSKIDAPDSTVPERIAENNVKTNAPTEHVLVVTIDEPAVLTAARQEKNSAAVKVASAIDEKDGKEAKSGGIWQQVNRFKHGELFARSDNASDDDQGLLSRAYTGLKQSLDKSKSTKQ